MASVDLVSPPLKLNSNDTLQGGTRGFNRAFPNRIPSVSVVQFTVKMFKLNGLGKTHGERVLVRELKLKLRSPFTTNKLFEKIQILMNESSID